MSKRRVKSQDEGDEQSANKSDDVPRGKGNSSLTPTPKLSPEAKLNNLKLGTIMGISLPLSLLLFWYVTLPLLSSCTVWLLGADRVQAMFYIKEDMMSYWSSECPLWMTAKERAYLRDHSEQQIRRVTDITRDDFIQIVKKGEPVIITDALRDWEALGQFNCEYLIEKYPDAEYFDWQGQHQMTLGNITQRPDFSGMSCASGYMEMFWQSNSKHVKEWLSKMKLPYFYPEDVTKETAFSHEGPSGSAPMTGFLGVPGTGVSPHLDETCDNLMTMQLSGVKNWSLSWPVRDGDELHWSKPLVFTLHPGEALLWYVSMQHHTEVIEDCSLSFSFMLKYPAPTDYFNRLVQELSLVDRTERDRFYESVGAAKVDFIDSCSLYESNGQEYIT